MGLQQMKVETGAVKEEEELSRGYFAKCGDLATIAKPFQLAAAGLQAAGRDLQTQFELVRALTQTKKHKLRLRVNTILENKKNRYPEQSIYEHSRVRLDDPQGEGYINANWIPLPRGSLIITQGPMEHTQPHLEQMIIQNGIQCVVMLCNIIEGDKVRCFDYLANRSTRSQQPSSLSATTVRLEGAEYVHLHYSEWPDRGVPEDNAQILELLDEVSKYERVVIHCSAGLGRSGVIACLIWLMQELREGKEVSVFEVALRVREHRFGAIQNSEQYGYIYRFLDYLSQLIPS